MNPLGRAWRWVVEPARFGVVLAVGLVASGFVTIVLGSRGTSRLAVVPFQLPYAISGVAGIGLVGAGLALADIQVGRRLRAQRRDQLDEMLNAVAGVARARNR